MEPRVLPAMNASTPSAFGAEWGEFYVGAGYQHATRPRPESRVLNRSDGAATAGFGLGRARRLALEIEYTTFTTVRSGFFNYGALSFKLFHQTASGWAIAAGRERAVTLGLEHNGGRAWYTAASRVFIRGDGTGPLGVLGLTVGAGDGRFRFVRYVNEGRQSVNAFASASATLSSPVSVITEWNGQDVTLAASVTPFRCVGLVLSPAIADLTGTAGSPRRFVFAFGLSGAATRVPQMLRRSCD